MVVLELFPVDLDEAVNWILQRLDEGIIIRKSLFELGFLIAHSED